MLSNGLKQRSTSLAWNIYPHTSQDVSPVNSSQVGTLWVNSNGELYYTDLLGNNYNISTRNPVYDTVVINDRIRLKFVSEHPNPATIPTDEYHVYAYKGVQNTFGGLYGMSYNVPRRNITTRVARAYTQYGFVEINGTTNPPFQFQSVIDTNQAIGALTRFANTSLPGYFTTITMTGEIQTATTNTPLQIRVTLGNIVVYESDIQTLQQVNNPDNVFKFDLTFINVRNGAAGTAEIDSWGVFQYTKNNGEVESYGNNYVNNTTYETISDQVVDISMAVGSDDQNSIITQIVNITTT